MTPNARLAPPAPARSAAPASGHAAGATHLHGTVLLAPLPVAAVCAGLMAAARSRSAPRHPRAGLRAKTPERRS